MIYSHIQTLIKVQATLHKIIRKVNNFRHHYKFKIIKAKIIQLINLNFQIVFHQQKTIIK